MLTGYFNQGIPELIRLKDVAILSVRADSQLNRGSAEMVSQILGNISDVDRTIPTAPNEQEPMDQDIPTMNLPQIKNKIDLRKEEIDLNDHH